MKLSVITINYNNAKGLKKTIESVITQDYNDFEYIVIDGASTDESIDVINNYSDKITHWISEPDTGIYNAMNKGIRLAKGEYLLFLNSGDCLVTNISLTDICKKFNNEDIIYCDVETIIPEKYQISNYSQLKLDFLFFLTNSLPHPSTFIKRTLFNTTGFYSENMKIVADWAFFMDAICLYNCTHKYIQICVSLFDGSGISQQEKNNQLILDEKEQHIKDNYSAYYSIHSQWKKQNEELHKLRTSRIVRYIKKFGYLKWFNIYGRR